MTVEHYECDQCGACCRKLILEAEIVEALREPKLVQVGRLLDGNGEIPLEQVEKIGLMGPDCACVFVQPDNRCSIYPTRPHMCVTFQAGGKQCQSVRSRSGLAPLEPTGREPQTIVERIAAMTRKEIDEERSEF